MSDASIFKAELSHSCYYGKKVDGWSDDWVFDLDEKGRITRVGKGGRDCFSMCGVAYLKASDVKKIVGAIDEAYKHPGTYENLFWDDIVNQEIKNVDLNIHEVFPNQIIELDTVAELAAFDPSYKSHF